MSLIKSINLIILYLTIAVFSIVLFSNYSSGDFYWTPLRSIYIFKTNDLLDFETIKRFLNSTIHNDSVKLFPTILEIISLKFSYNWEPRISLLLGLGSWLLNFYLYFKLILRSFKLTLKQQKVLALILFLCFFGPPYFFYRFTIVFALFKTLPSLCLLSITKILFKNDSNINNLDLISICAFCLIAQFSYSWGSILWITSYFILFSNYLLFKTKYINLTKLVIFGFIGTFSITLYISILDFSTLNSLFIKNNISLNSLDIFNSIKDFYSFLSTFSFSYIGGFDIYSSSFPKCLFNTDIVNIPECGVSKLYLSISIIIFSLFYILLLIQIIQLKQKAYFKTFIYQSAPFLFIAFNLSIIPMANLLLRSQNISPPRYFTESTIYSISIVLIILISLSINNFRIFKIFILNDINIIRTIEIL